MARPGGPNGCFLAIFGSFRHVGHPDGPNASFRYRFEPFRLALGTILDHFATWVAQMVQMIAFGTIFKTISPPGPPSGLNQ